MAILELEPQLHDPMIRVHETLECPNWAPWLRFDTTDLSEHRLVFPEGQILKYDHFGNPQASLDTNRINWDGDVNALGTWDDVAGTYSSFEEAYVSDGNTIALLSMSVRDDLKHGGYATSVIEEIREIAETQGVEHLIGDFRPSGYGEYKRLTGRVNFAEYIQEAREDGLLTDGWLRAVSRLGASFHKVDPRAMVVPATLEELYEYSVTYNPESWWQVTNPEDISSLIDWHGVMQDIEQVDEVWECGEAGTWFVDKKNGSSVYIETNVWGEIPLNRTQENIKFKARYDLTPDEQTKLESKIVEEIKERFNGTEDIFGIWIKPSHEYANLIRTLEANTTEFAGIENVIDDSVEARSKFFALVDTRNGEDRIIHASRISGAIFDEELAESTEVADSESTGFVAINELTASGQDFSVDDFKRYYEKAGIDLNSCIGVETNFTVGKRAETGIDGIRVSDLGYIAFFLLLERNGLEPNKSSVFSFVNEYTEKSLGSIGVDFEPLAGRTDLKTPDVNGGFTDEFWPVRIPISDKVVQIFSLLKPFAVEEIEV